MSSNFAFRGVVLVVEDTPEHTEYIDKILNDYAILAFHARSFPEAKQKLLLLRPDTIDAVIVDWALKGGDGEDEEGRFFLEHVEKDPRYKNIHRLVVSGYFTKISLRIPYDATIAKPDKWQGEDYNRFVDQLRETLDRAIRRDPKPEDPELPPNGNGNGYDENQKKIESYRWLIMIAIMILGIIVAILSI